MLKKSRNGEEYLITHSKSVVKEEYLKGDFDTLKFSIPFNHESNSFSRKFVENHFLPKVE